MGNQLEIYQQVIVEHNKKPRNFRKLEDSSHSAEGFNPLCGDNVKIYLRLNEDKMIEEVTFEGIGCAISKASASMMTAALKGKSIDEADGLFKDFQALIKGELSKEQEERLGKLKIFAGVCRYPARVKCAGLPWHTMHGALEDKKETIKTE